MRVLAVSMVFLSLSLASCGPAYQAEMDASNLARNRGDIHVMKNDV